MPRRARPAASVPPTSCVRKATNTGRIAQDGGLVRSGCSRPCQTETREPGPGSSLARAVQSGTLAARCRTVHTTMTWRAVAGTPRQSAAARRVLPHRWLSCRPAPACAHSERRFAAMPLSQRAGPLEVLRARVAAGQLRHDLRQIAAAVELQRIHAAMPECPHPPISVPLCMSLCLCVSTAGLSLSLSLSLSLCVCMRVCMCVSSSLSP